jgi:hypothetical protein
MATGEVADLVLEEVEDTKSVELPAMSWRHVPPNITEEP